MTVLQTGVSYCIQPTGSEHYNDCIQLIQLLPSITKSMKASTLQFLCGLPTLPLWQHPIHSKAHKALQSSLSDSDVRLPNTLHRQATLQAIAAL